MYYLVHVVEGSESISEYSDADLVNICPQSTSISSGMTARWQYLSD